MNRHAAPRKAGAPRRAARLSLPVSKWPAETVLLRTRHGFHGTEDIFSLTEATLSRFEDVEPWRVPGFHHGQTSKAGWYWSVTNQGLTSFESGPELEFLVRADMDDDAQRIISQPFMMCVNAHHARSYVPDFLVVDKDSGIRIVEVKSSYRHLEDSVVSTQEWARHELEAHGWVYEVHTELDPQEAENRLFLATYRRSWQFDPDLLQHILSNVERPETFGSLETRFAEAVGQESGIVRAHLLHFCWAGDLALDLRDPIDRGTLLTPGKRISNA